MPSKPDKAQLQEVIDCARATYINLDEGENASYIPFLARVPRYLCGLSIATLDGDIISAGDTDYRFAIESISKVATLALALEDVGPDAVQKKVGADPTGLPFNSVMALELHNGKPLSPLVNAGAISTVSLVEAADREERWARILLMQRKLTGGDIVLSSEVNGSEQTTNFHNRAISWLLYSAEALYCDPMEACDIYTRQCSTLVDTRDLAVMAATLAGGGVNPLTGEQVLSADRTSPKVLAEMMMEGLYTSSGDWAYSVGLPGKSGVGGGVLAVVPGIMGIAAFSPPLDDAGNSVRGQKMIGKVASALDYNLFSTRF
ncbi:glutaminase A [Microbulbifer halophilus]|uniref:Glutaminase n=1 Tax=Microbulbifer halophilus TaxID=453963 RepID=A0ABW5EEC9_9GAMM|nr:glutaminase A [Microbulbifer halophilus]MCW8128551.1 glutaminase A [Microbulbifer halophilus]